MKKAVEHVRQIIRAVLGFKRDQWTGKLYGPEKLYVRAHVGDKNGLEGIASFGTIDSYRNDFAASREAIELTEYTKTGRIKLEFPANITRIQETE